MTEVQALVATASIQKMISNGYLDSQRIYSLMEMLGIPQMGNPYHTLVALHGVDFKSMNAELQSQIPVLLAEVFRSDWIDWTPIFDRFKPMPESGVNRAIAWLRK